MFLNVLAFITVFIDYMHTIQINKIIVLFPRMALGLSFIHVWENYVLKPTNLQYTFLVMLETKDPYLTPACSLLYFLAFQLFFLIEIVNILL